VWIGAPWQDASCCPERVTVSVRDVSAPIRAQAACNAAAKLVESEIDMLDVLLLRLASELQRANLLRQRANLVRQRRERTF
jgi:hypothetical protein